jgi:hypothetical protein
VQGARARGIIPPNSAPRSVSGVRADPAMDSRKVVPQLIRLRVSKRIFATLCRNNRIEALKGRLKFSELDHFLFEFRRKRIVAILGLR